MTKFIKEPFLVSSEAFESNAHVVTKVYTNVYQWYCNEHDLYKIEKCLYFLVCILKAGMIVNYC